ncbi:MAG: hypothetical protein P1U57_03675 [Oleibacter sp.]|nr:hypothetical protein [Thalassolituus sp.]
MKKHITALCLIGLLVGWSNLSAAEETKNVESANNDSHNSDTEAQQDEPSRVQRTQTLRQIVYERLEKARNLSDEGNTIEALDTLMRLDQRKRNSYERAMTYSLFGYVYSAKEDYENAATSYEALLGIEQAPDALKQTTRFSLAKLYMVQEKYDSALSTLNDWMSTSDNVGADAFLLRSQVQYQKGNFKDSVADVQHAIAMRKEDGNKAPENWLLLERAGLFQLKDYKSMAKNLEALVSGYSKSDYWLQLAAVYNELGLSKKELATLETAYEQGLLVKENELMNFAQALLAQEIPYKAATVLKRGMDEKKIDQSARNLSLLGDAWMLAKEYDNAIEVMTLAANVSGKGSDYFKLSQIYTERQEYDLALEFSDKALAANDMKEPYQALIIKGLAQFNLKQLNAAQATFNQAAKYPAAEKISAQWLQYIATEKTRQEYLAQSAG